MKVYTEKGLLVIFHIFFIKINNHNNYNIPIEILKVRFEEGKMYAGPYHNLIEIEKLFLKHPRLKGSNPISRKY